MPLRCGPVCRRELQEIASLVSRDLYSAPHRLWPEAYYGTLISSAKPVRLKRQRHERRPGVEAMGDVWARAIKRGYRGNKDQRSRVPGPALVERHPQAQQAIEFRLDSHAMEEAPWLQIGSGRRSSRGFNASQNLLFRYLAIRKCARRPAVKELPADRVVRCT